MKKDRSNWTVRKVSFEEAEDEDLLFWASKTIGERLKEAFDWNKKVWTHLLGTYPDKIELTGGKKLKTETDKDDF